jgi:TonB-linked SusC/RagA family outer membrane protein
VVKDQQGNPLPGVSIQVKGTSNGTVTDATGKFTLSVPEGAVLQVSFVGYASQQVTVGTRTMVSITLQPSTMALNQLVVVGYGSEKKQNLTGAVATLDMSQKSGQPITNASQALYGVSGLYVNTSNSHPGVDNSTILIRGMGTLSSNAPLVLVDGVEHTMDEINPQDIATITVLKDASAAIYGSRAANGVILITTKTGSGKPHVQYNYYYGIQKPTYLPDAVWDPITYMKMLNQAQLNEGKTAVTFSDADIERYQNGMKTDPLDYPAINWFKRVTQNGQIQNHDLSVSGGSDVINYRMSLGYLNQHGILIGNNNDNDKYYIGMNTSIKVGPRLTLGLDLHGDYRYYTQPYQGIGDYWTWLMRALPIMPDTLADGAFGYSYLRVPGRNSWENPLMTLTVGGQRMRVQNFLATIHGSYKLPFGITYNAKMGIAKYDGLRFITINQLVEEQSFTGAINHFNSPLTAPRRLETYFKELDLHFYNTLDWKHTFASNHNVGVMLGSSFDQYKGGSFEAQMTGYLDETLTALQAGSQLLNIHGQDSYEGLVSGFGRINYNYKEKYLLEGIFRADGSSRFAPGRRWGFFPGVSAGWRIDKEPFFHGVRAVDMLKLRASVGQMGNQAVPLYAYQNNYTLNHYYSFGGPNATLAQGAAVTAYSDPTTSWETTTDYNVGVDASFLNNTLSFTGDVYKKWTTGILETVNLPAHVDGLSGPVENVGTVSNIGYEISVGYQNHVGDFHYSVRGNVSYNKNKVINLGGQILYNYNTNLSTITEAGHAIGSYYVLDAEGIFQSDQEVATSAFQSTDTKAGYLKYRDVNGDGTINGNDRIVINSSSMIPKYNYSFGFNLGYHGISLVAYFQGIGRFYVAPIGNMALPLNNGAGVTWDWYYNSWTPSKPNAKLPILTEANYSTVNFQPSNFWLRNAAYLRLKSLTLGYDLPQNFLSKLKISKINVFVNAENWWTLTKFKLQDPESIYNANSLYHYPTLKTISVGVRADF